MDSDISDCLKICYRLTRFMYEWSQHTVKESNGEIQPPVDPLLLKWTMYTPASQPSPEFPGSSVREEPGSPFSSQALAPVFIFGVCKHPFLEGFHPEVPKGAFNSLIIVPGKLLQQQQLPPRHPFEGHFSIQTAQRKGINPPPFLAPPSLYCASGFIVPNGRPASIYQTIR